MLSTSSLKSSTTFCQLAASAALTAKSVNRATRRIERYFFIIESPFFILLFRCEYIGILSYFVVQKYVGILAEKGGDF